MHSANILTHLTHSGNWGLVPRQVKGRNFPHPKWLQISGKEKHKFCAVPKYKLLEAWVFFRNVGVKSSPPSQMHRFRLYSAGTLHVKFMPKARRGLRVYNWWKGCYMCNLC